jgi:hypothetical protein
MSQQFWVHCEACRYSWLVATIPMDVDRFCKKAGAALKAGCPACDGRKILVGRAKELDPPATRSMVLE